MKSKFFTASSNVLERAGLVVGYIAPVLVKQIDDFKK